MAAPLSVSEAQARLLKDVTPLGVEQVLPEAALHRVLAANLTAAFDQPPFAASAMDGYAVRAADFEGAQPGAAIELTLDVAGTSSAGHPFNGAARPGQVVRIFTGSELPQGADSIVIQENCRAKPEAEAEPEAGTVTVLTAPAKGQYVRPKGYDFHAGTTLLTEGTALHYRHLTLLASMNIAKVPVRRRPRVGILATGDELIPPGGDLGPGEIVSSVPYGLAGLINNAGGIAELIGIARDHADDLAAKIAASDGMDVLVTIGGASVGDHDLVQEALIKAGMTLDFWRIAMRPGKPLMVGERSGAWGRQKVIGVPGNPVSALITAKIFLEPLLQALLGVAMPYPRLYKARLMSPLPENGPRQHYMRAHADLLPDGFVVRAMEDQDSSLQALFAASNALIVRAPHAGGLGVGDSVDIIRLDREY